MKKQKPEPMETWLGSHTVQANRKQSEDNSLPLWLIFQTPWPPLSQWCRGSKHTCIQGRQHGVWLLDSPFQFSSVKFSSVAQSCPTLCDPMNRSMPGLPVHHHLLEFTQIHVHRVSDAIQPSHPRSSPSPPAPNSSQHQSLFQWVNSSHEVAKVLEFQL